MAAAAVPGAAGGALVVGAVAAAAAGAAARPGAASGIDPRVLILTGERPMRATSMLFLLPPLAPVVGPEGPAMLP
jgi:hypothetical protein